MKNRAPKTVLAKLYFIVALNVVGAPLVGAHNYPWTEKNIKNYDKCLNFKTWTAPKEVNPALFPIICGFVEKHGKTFVHHSDKRPGPSHSPGSSRASKHITAEAIDFRVDTYEGMDKCEKWRTFADSTLLFVGDLELQGVMCSVGFGFYPDQNNPFWHCDSRGCKPDGTPSTWSRIAGKYQSLTYGVNWIVAQYEKQCGRVLYFDISLEAQLLYERWYEIQG